MRDSTKWRATGLIFCLIIFGVLMWAGCYFFDDMLGLVSKKDKIVFWLLSMLLFGLFLGLLTLGVWSHQKGLRFQGRAGRPNEPGFLASRRKKVKVKDPLKSHLRRRYAFFWRRKVRLLLVTGDEASDRKSVV